MLRCIEQEACNKSFMHQNRKIKFKDWFKQIDSKMSVAAVLECMVLRPESAKENDSMEKLVVSKLVAIGDKKSAESDNLK